MNKKNYPDSWTIRQKLLYSPGERPIVCQIFGSDPEKYRGAVTYIKELGFDGVDINMGCPERNVIKCGAGMSYLKPHGLN